MMKSKNVRNTGFILIFGIAALAGASNIASAQERKEKRDESQNQPRQDRSAAHQEQYKQQQTQNQQRFEQRQQSYQDFHRQRMNNSQPNQQNVQIRQQQQIKNRQQPIQNDQRTLRITQSNQQPQIQNRQDRQSQYAPRQINDRERQQLQIKINNWDKSERGWQTQYNSRWQQSQRRFEEQSRILQQQNREAQLGFQRAYWERVREDRDRLQNWQFYNDVALDYSYLRGGQYYYTSQYGLNMLTDAVNDGYQEGFLAGQADREDNYQYDYRDAFAFQDASYGYNGYWVDLSEYQYYFRDGFQNGYDDGFYSRYRYGTFTNGNYAVNASFLKGLLNFTFIGR
jgi:hypothetical protein